MISTMMSEPLLISSLIRHAAAYHGDTSVVSVEQDGSVVNSKPSSAFFSWAGGMPKRPS